ncbi:MAG: aspartate aminotransferase family protein, partial [Bacteroidales bacterium]|nr:aspartate aminotransferase family protein [Bacteroidales bacterium]
FFTESAQVTSFAEAMTADTERYARHFRQSLDKGLYIAPSQFECTFVSDAHTYDDVDKLIHALT